MKTINIKNVQIDEIIIKPNDHMVIRYNMLDDNGEFLYQKVKVIKNEEFPQLGKLTTFVTSLLGEVKGDEGV